MYEFLCFLKNITNHTPFQFCSNVLLELIDSVSSRSQLQLEVCRNKHEEEIRKFYNAAKNLDV